MYSISLNVVVVFLTMGGAAAVLNEPRNVRLYSTNMNLVLRWDSPEGETNDLLYTAECITSVPLCQMGCVNISTFECDFTSLNIYLSVYGSYKARVRALRGSESSSWVESKQITLSKYTLIGSPNVLLFSNGATIEIQIEEPEFATSNFNNVFGPSTYNITYWKDDQSEKGKHITSLSNRPVLNDLDPWTKYCVQVQIMAEGSRRSMPSRKVCASTTGADAAYVPALVTFLILAMAVTLLVIAVVYRRRISDFLCPEDKLSQYLLATPSSSLYWAMHNCDRPEEIYNSVNVIREEKPVE
ncbi:interleukin-10 receptor subunit beta-like [Corythoichthys intestinalis]|uniref:interleukin-10 receptor subunit beta-like n=1 Tax=Corythoichthys intestinalis TaxID=161448 RepID=UPI0025A54D0E|nr:interleukin-10 receptor subunit beta-like [Corythoichthys intestinalis]